MVRSLIHACITSQHSAEDADGSEFVLPISCSGRPACLGIKSVGTFVYVTFLLTTLPIWVLRHTYLPTPLLIQPYPTTNHFFFALRHICLSSGAHTTICFQEPTVISQNLANQTCCNGIYFTWTDEMLSLSTIQHNQRIEGHFGVPPGPTWRTAALHQVCTS